MSWEGIVQLTSFLVFYILLNLWFSVEIPSANFTGHTSNESKLCTCLCFLITHINRGDNVIFLSFTRCLRWILPPIYGQHSERYTSHNGCIYRTYDRQGTWAAGRVINLIIPVWWLYLYGTCLYIILIEETLLQMKSNFSFNHDSVKSFKTLLINLTSTLMSLFNYGITNGRRRFNNIYFTSKHSQEQY